MSPGVTCFPLPSMSNAFPRGKEMFFAILRILPSWNKISCSFKIPLGPEVQIVASSINTILGSGKSESRPYAPSGYVSSKLLANSFFGLFLLCLASPSKVADQYPLVPFA